MSARHGRADVSAGTRNTNPSVNYNLNLLANEGPGHSLNVTEMTADDLVRSSEENSDVVPRPLTSVQRSPVPRLHPATVSTGSLEDRRLMDGALDTSFDFDGKTTVAFNLDRHSLGGRAMAIQADGKIVVVGDASSSSGDTEVAVIRLNPDGSLDTSFDHDGKQTIGFTNLVGVELQPRYRRGDPGRRQDRRRRLRHFHSLSRSSTRMVRSTTSFDHDGKQTIDFGSDSDFGYAVAVQADGKIVVAGYSYQGATGYYSRRHD